MMKRRVLFLIESMDGGGAEKVLYTLLNNLNLDKFEVTLCTVNEGGLYIDNQLKKKVRYVPLIKRQKSKSLIHRLSYLIKFKLIYKILPLSWVYSLFVPKGHDVEVAFIEGFSTKLLSHSTNKKAKKIAWVHIDLVKNHWISEVYSSLKEEKNSYNKYDQIIGVSKTVSRSVKTLYGLNNVRTIYNPIDSDLIKALSNNSIESGLVRNNRIRICSVGRFVKQKRFDRLLRIVHWLKKEGIDVELWLLGGGVLTQEYFNYVNRAGIKDNVKFLGFKSNPYRYMKACDLFVCSSFAEGYSTAMTEACILGLPMITTDCSGMDEILDNGEYGIITPNDTESLYSAVKSVITDSELLRKYKNKSEARSDFFSLSKLIPPVEEILL